MWRVVPGQAPTIFQSGFTTIIDITFGADGTLYVLEFDPGNLWRVPANAPRSLVATGFIAPGSVTIGSDGAFYVSNCGIFSRVGPGPGQCAGGGQVVRIPA